MIDPSKSLIYNITIQCSLDGFCFVLHDLEEGKIIDVDLYQTSETDDVGIVMEALEKLLLKKGLYEKPVHSVRFIVSNRYCVLVPEEVFDETHAEAYLRFGHDLPQGYRLLSTPMHIVKSVNVFAMPKIQEEILKKMWPDITITHQSSIFLNSIFKEAHNGSETSAFVNVSSHFFELAIIEKQRLRFYNNFRFNTKDDFVYFLMFALEQHGWTGKDFPVYFTGLITNQSEILQLCERYIKRIRFIRPDGSVDVDMSLNDTPFQYYYIPYKSLL